MIKKVVFSTLIASILLFNKGFGSDLRQNILDNEFIIHRGLDQYNRTLNVLESLDNLSQNKLNSGFYVWLDSGSGAAVAMIEYWSGNKYFLKDRKIIEVQDSFFKTPLKNFPLKTIAIGVTKPNLATTLEDYLPKFADHKYYEGTLESYLTNNPANFPKIDLITDFFGASTYAIDPFQIINLYAKNLTLGGKALIHTFQFSLEDARGQELPFDIWQFAVKHSLLWQVGYELKIRQKNDFSGSVIYTLELIRCKNNREVVDLPNLKENTSKSSISGKINRSFLILAN